MRSVAVIIPVYKTINELCDFEKRSIINNTKVLSNRSIIFICPRSIEKEVYSDLCGLKIKFNHLEVFDDFFFTSTKSYNLLLINTMFYKFFKRFEFIYICQTDVWVFYDDLNTFINLNYAYIGGMCFEFNTIQEIPHIRVSKLIGPINGGASLRNVRKHIKLLNTSHTNETLYLSSNLINAAFDKSELGFFDILEIIKNNQVKRTIHNSQLNEDYNLYFAFEKHDSDSVPNKNEAILFSWDVAPWALYSFTKKLPMAAHAWFRDDGPYKGNFDFWKKFIT